MATLKGCKTCGDRQIYFTPGTHAAQAARCPNCFVTCKKCDGTGFTFTRDQDQREVALACECRATDQKILLYNQAGIPAQFYDAQMSNFETGAHKSLADARKTAGFLRTSMSKGDWKGLLFMGGVGVGKTRLVSSLIHQFTIEYKVPCLFKEFTHLLSSIKTQYDQGQSEAVVLAPIAAVDLLVIDELGKGRGSEWEISILDSIISNRYAHKKTTLFTTNYTEDRGSSYADVKGKEGIRAEAQTLEERVGPRIYSRLKGMCTFVMLEGPDRRLPENERIGR
ncbi:MAG: hypothetical protein A2508_01410 [Candidatus Lambdaproteobacteria bacterium RIFOXYD12_FULL_49_8]|uniref:IstB-like ATP-binding domain-containing protein n=1 Tax=Candidatus Lambdaproteobacteria bacterium RIFOXYD2_FULL_50_16 TaxID=1817772 RepID=A0A1F6G5B5_9PROT|nr:MAG: hypothetical protein A2527_13715 [Candidatus Lambdaproteobacteria bacterium RIFOXYD2_FULL_50_16]OGG97703.1 MAG: hypothetical protein A2508_01410 [Candidatus Lambdaproteobacteria bacterium RIFOXYD12_FULL_49_8]